jgi:hypothetical protein
MNPSLESEHDRTRARRRIREVIVIMNTGPAVLGDKAAAASETADWRELVAILHDKDRHIQELEAECRGLAEQLMAFQAEILKWVELDR